MLLFFVWSHLFFVEKFYLVLVLRINTHWCIYICTTFIIWFCGKNIEEQKKKGLGRLQVKWVSQGPKINCLELRRLSSNNKEALICPIWRPGFEILRPTGSEIQHWEYARDVRCWKYSSGLWVEQKCVSGWQD